MLLFPGLRTIPRHDIPQPALRRPQQVARGGLQGQQDGGAARVRHHVA